MYSIGFAIKEVKDLKQIIEILLLTDVALKLTQRKNVKSENY